jgi:hypothetical protein
MKPSLSQQSSLYAQVYEKKGTKGALAPVASRHDLRNEKDTKTSPQRKNKKTFSPTKAIAVLGGGLVGLTGLYMGVGQKIKTFLFGETPKPSPPSIPPTPVLFEVVEDIPVPEKNMVQKATEAVENRLQAGLGKVKQGAETTGSAIVHVTNEVVHKPFQAGMNRQGIAFNWLEQYLLMFNDATLGRLVRPPSNASPFVVQTAPIEVLHTISPSTLEGESVIPNNATKMSNPILEWIANAWEQTGYDPLEGKWKAKELGTSVDEVIEVVAEHVPETVKELKQGIIHKTRIMHTATHMAIAGAEYMPTMTTGSAGLDLFAIAMHALYGAGARVVRHVKVPKP